MPPPPAARGSGRPGGRLGGARTGGRAILTSDQEALPTPSRLESAILALETRGDQRDLIGFVETWSAVGEPTRAARLAQARAFVDLCMLDRAWIRLKELRETDDDDVDVLALTARMFLKRGWPNRARRPLDKALAVDPDDERLQQLWDAAAEPPAEPDSSLEESDDLEVLLPLAERYLCTGAMLKGRALLERLRREHPDHERVADLLWVLGGDFSLGDRSLAELAEEFGPDLSMLADLADESEHTESITKEELAASREAPDGAPFPSLFRSEQGAGATATDADEITRATSLADLDELRESVESARKSAGIVSGEEDTQIRRVIRRDSGLDVGDADTVHVPSTVPDEVDFDLEEYRSQMGMGQRPALPASDLDDPLEQEDDDLIILTKRERDDPDAAPLLEPDPTSETMDHPDARRFLAEAERYRERDEPEPTEEAPAPTPRPKRRRRRRPAPTGSTPMWLLALAIVLGILAFFLAILVTYQFLVG